jgi:cysteinyl-tRNA synthetase
MTNPLLQERLALTNTLTKRKEPFRPADPARVTMYICGPTVWSYAHIGNARAAVAFDLLFRVLRAAYGEAAIRYVRNITDVDDKIINASNATGEAIPALVERFAAIYQADMGALGALPPTLQPRATEFIGPMIELIEALASKGAAYSGKSGMFFSVAADTDYGKLSGRDINELTAAARVEPEPGKKAPADFALWKLAKKGEPSWESPFGAGRPGWHIECSAMIRGTLGETIDIHGGGHDLIFPHHENEIAQSETAHGAPLARYWLHNGFLTMESEKMSKSLGNVTLVHDLLKKWDGEVLRWALLSAQYRQPLDWSDALLEQSKAGLDRLYGALDRLADVDAQVEDAAPPEAFLAALADDLNTPQAMAELFAMAARANKAEKPAAQEKAKAELLAAGALIGHLGQEPARWFGRSGGGEAAIEALVAARVAARVAKNWAEADRLRAALEAQGVVVMDGPQGSTWRRIGPAS